MPTPQREKKPLIVETVESEQGKIDKNTSNEASSAKVDEVDKTNAANVESKDDKIDTIAKGAESQDDNAAKSERDEDPGAKIDEVADKENGQVPQVCGSEADVEQATEASQQHQQQPLSNELLDEEPVHETQTALRAEAAPAFQSTLAQAVRLELERVRFEEEALRRYKRVRARSPNARRRAH